MAQLRDSALIRREHEESIGAQKYAVWIEYRQVLRNVCSPIRTRELIKPSAPSHTYTVHLSMHMHIHPHCRTCPPHVWRLHGSCLRAFLANWHTIQVGILWGHGQDGLEVGSLVQTGARACVGSASHVWGYVCMCIYVHGAECAYMRTCVHERRERVTRGL